MTTIENARPAANGTGAKQVGQTGVDSTQPAWQRTSGTRDSARPPRPVGLVASVLAAQPWFRAGTLEQRRTLVQAVQDAARRAHDRKARVKAHPDLADRLCRSLGYTRFNQWNGFVPPARDSGGHPNNYPVRAELLAVLRAVAEREAEQQ